MSKIRIKEQRKRKIKNGEIICSLYKLKNDGGVISISFEPYLAFFSVISDFLMGFNSKYFDNFVFFNISYLEW